jgi:PIN domain nuclease of toxin-antitoxin system
MKPILLDTHALVRWVEQSKRMPTAQRRAIDRAAARDALWASDISLWEIGMLVEDRRLALSLPLGEWVARAVAPPRVRVSGITPEVVAEMIALASTYAWDPADRVLVATARVLGATLATADERIIESEIVATLE